MTHPSVFINEAKEAAQVLTDISSKGRIYGTFRYNAEIPDILACEGETFQKRKQILDASFQSVLLKDDAVESLFQDLMTSLASHAEKGEALDAKKVFSLFALDCICHFYFSYSLNGVQGSEEAIGLLNSLQTHADANAAAGIYPAPDARKVPPEELATAKTTWKTFLEKIVKHIKANATEYKVTNGALDVKNNPAHALVQLTIEYPEEIGDKELWSEVNQLLRHGHESIATTMMWMTYDLYRIKKVSETMPCDDI